MGAVGFPRAGGACSVDAALVGGLSTTGKVRIIIASSADHVTFLTGRSNGSINTNGFMRYGANKPGTLLSPEELRSYASIARGCAGALERPAGQTGLRVLAQRLEGIANRRPIREARCGTSGCY